MPKKRTFNFKKLQGASSSSSAATTASNGDPGPSVNERLSELRKLEGKDAAAKKRLLAESVNQRSVPPEVRGILGVPESAPPKPKVGLRARDRMRTPGPAPPKSWVASSSTTWTSTLSIRGGRKGPKRDADLKDRNRPRQLLRFARLTGLEDDSATQTVPRLTHLALKAIAQSWYLFDEEDYPALTDVPLRLRLRLLSYIGYYGIPLDSHELQAILQGGESITRLDVAGLIGFSNLTAKKLARLIEKDQDIGSNDAQDVLESWDAEISLESVLQPPPGSNRFSSLTHLCLSHPGPKASWRDLLTLSKVTPQVTHLSLAHWPRPTLTPNLATTSVSSQNSPDVLAGGSHYYSALDQDMTEPASLLRQLSGHLLRLQWLDLEGCHEWIPALAKLAANPPVVPMLPPRTPQSDDWTAVSYTASALSTNWKNLTYLHCSQGWLPSLIGIQSLAERNATALDRLLIDGIVKHLKETVGDVSDTAQLSHDVLDLEKKRARIWLEIEYKLTYSCMRINSARRSEGCKAVGMDFGWVQRHVSAVQG